MYVKDHMTKNPTTVTKETPISKALDLMNQGKFHRLPVVDENNTLIGLITEGMVSESSGKNSTSLSIYELNYLLSRTTVEEIMEKHVHTVKENIFLEEAASVMLDAEISVLPVVDDNNKVVGIITEKDMFQAFVDLMGYKHQGTKFVISCEDTPGIFAKAAKLFADNDANLESCAVYHTEERGAEVVIKATGEISVEDMQKILEDNGFDLTSIIQTDYDVNKIVYLNKH